VLREVFQEIEKHKLSDEYMPGAEKWLADMNGGRNSRPSISAIFLRGEGVIQKAPKLLGAIGGQGGVNHYHKWYLAQFELFLRSSIRISRRI